MKYVAERNEEGHGGNDGAMKKTIERGQQCNEEDDSEMKMERR